MVILAMPFFIAPYRHVKPLDRQTYYQHHRQAHSANGEQWRGDIRLFKATPPTDTARPFVYKKISMSENLKQNLIKFLNL